MSAIALQEAGIKLQIHRSRTDADKVDAVYVGWHPDCGMKDIEVACNAIWNGAEALCRLGRAVLSPPRRDASMGYSHAITAAIRKLTRAPMILTGKPSLNALRYVAKKLGVPMTKVGVVGDDPAVEVIMAHRGGATSFGVTTGFNKAADWAAQPANHQPAPVAQGGRRSAEAQGTCCLMRSIDYFDKMAKLHPDRAALIAGGTRYTYGELRALTHKLAGAMRAAGSKHQEPAAILSPNDGSVLVSLLGIVARRRGLDSRQHAQCARRQYPVSELCPRRSGCSIIPA